MIRRAARKTLARFAGAALAAGVAILLIVFGPRVADLPASVGAIPDWFTAAPEQALVTVIGAVAWVCLLWLCLGMLLGAMAAIPGATGLLSAAVARRIIPRAMRRMIEISLGVTLVAGVAPVLAALPASAATGHPGSGIGVSATTVGLPDLGRPSAAASQVSRPAAGLPDLDLPSAAVHTAAAAATAAAGAGAGAGGPAASSGHCTTLPTAGTGVQNVDYRDAQPAPPASSDHAAPGHPLPDLDRPSSAPSAPTTAAPATAATSTAAPAAGPGALTTSPGAATPAAASASPAPLVATAAPTAATPATSAGIPAARSPDPNPDPSPDPSPLATAGAGPTVSVPGLGTSIPVVDLQATTSASSPRTPSSSPGSASGGDPVHTAPDPGAPMRLTAARSTAMNLPDLDRPSTGAPRPASATPPPAAPSTPGPTPARPANPAPSPGAVTPPRDPIVPPSHRGTGVPASPADATTTPHGTGAEEVVVLRGDSLWTIAARHLGPTATHEQIAAEWPRWWAANSDVIGHDPNLILPGQRLRPPSGP